MTMVQLLLRRHIFRSREWRGFALTSTGAALDAAGSSRAVLVDFVRPEGRSTYGELHWCLDPHNPSGYKQSFRRG